VLTHVMVVWGEKRKECMLAGRSKRHYNPSQLETGLVTNLQKLLVTSGSNQPFMVCCAVLCCAVCCAAAA
jgi:hypothetical protein